ncbi:MAG TPA: hypothetical protein VMH20_01620 [Verrucomicrobiae bacterium]|nr:hypothetical protein [Verrucomicrobiae bacterium]
MRKLLLLVVCLVAFASALQAQEDEKFQAGVFADYFRSGATGTNMFGLGGRAGLDLVPHVTLEGDVAYDFNRGFNNAFSYDGGGAAFITSGVRTLDAFFGPRYTITNGRVRPFVELKAGFIDYMFNNVPVGSTSVSNGIQNLINQNINAALLFGGGVERKAGPVVLRLDVADQIYFNHGAQQGLRVTFGPLIRF